MACTTWPACIKWLDKELGTSSWTSILSLINNRSIPFLKQKVDAAQFQVYGMPLSAARHGMITAAVNAIPNIHVQYSSHAYLNMLIL